MTSSSLGFFSLFFFFFPLDHHHAATQLHSPDDLGPGDPAGLHRGLPQEREPVHAVRHQILGSSSNGEKLERFIVAHYLFLFFLCGELDLDICDDFWSDVEPYSWSSICPSQPSNRPDG